jgi:hypothetical protein
MNLSKYAPNLIWAIASLFFPAICFGAELTAQDTESKLIGDWQVGLNAINKTAPVEYAFKTGLIGVVWRIKADHTIETYFPCEFESIVRKTGYKSPIVGKWHLDEKNVFYVRFDGFPLGNGEYDSVEKKGKVIFDENPGFYGTGTMSIKDDSEQTAINLGRLDVSQNLCN